MGKNIYKADLPNKKSFKYFQTQLETSKTDGITSADNFEFRCPMRNIINFKFLKL